MKSRIKVLMVLSVSLLVIFALTAFLSFFFTNINRNKNEGKSEKLILGFSQIGSESAWRTRNTQSIFEAAAANDIQILFDDAQQKQENQIKAIRSFIR